MPRYLGLGKQSGFGTAVSPTKFIDVNTVNVAPAEDKTFPVTVSYRGPVSWFPGPKYSEPEAESFIWPEGGHEHVFRAFFQSVTTTTLDATNGVYQHVYTPANLGASVTYYTFEVGYDNLTAARVPNAVVGSLEFSFTPEEPPMLSFSAVGGFPTTVSQATPSYPAVRPFNNGDIDAKIGGTTVQLQELTIELSNSLERRHDLTAALRAIDFQEIEVGGSFSARFLNTDHLNRFLNATETSLQVVLTGPVAGGTYNYKLQIDLPRIIYETWDVEVSGAELLVEDVDFIAVKPSADAIAKITLVNKVSSI